MKKMIIIFGAILVVLYMLFSGGHDNTNIMEYKGTIQGVKGNTVELTSGLHVRLIGVRNRTDVEMYIKDNFIGKNVTLVPDSQGDQEIGSLDDTVGAYVVLDDNLMSINHLVVSEYNDAYVPTELSDSLNWVPVQRAR